MLGALYLSPLDNAFEHRQGLFYVRFMDDIVILTENKRQYVKAKKRLFAVLGRLKLSLSSHKTRMGLLGRGFHFLGVDFEVPQNPQKQIQEATVNLHARTCRRALDKVNALSENAVHPANIQRYLIRWATWWYRAMGVRVIALIDLWVGYVSAIQPAQAWLGRGLLLT